MDKLPVIYGRSHKPISLIIQARTACRWSHIGALKGDKVLESIGGIGVVETDLKDFLNRYRNVQTGWVYCLNLQDAYNYIEVRKGRLHDKKAIVGILFKLGLDDVNAEHCSELIAGARGLKPKSIISQITPADILLDTHDIQRVK